MDYYITSKGELRHAAPNRGWEKEDHKYIKREWKKGKWVYTYPSDAKKQSGIKNVANVVSSTAKSTASKVATANILIKNKKIDATDSKALSTGKKSYNSTLQRGTSTVAKLAGDAYKNVDKHTRENYMKLVTDSAKNMVKGNSKVADALSYCKVQADRADTLQKAANNASAKIGSSSNPMHTAEKIRELARIRMAAIDANHSLMSAAGKLKTALEETAVDRLMSEHDAYTSSRFLERYGDKSDTSSMVDYYESKEQKIRDGSFYNKEITKDGAERDFSLASFTKGVQDWYGVPEGKELDKADLKLFRAELDLESAEKREVRARTEYERIRKLAEEGAITDVRVLNTYYDMWAYEADNHRIESARYFATRAEYEKAVEAYMKTPAGDLERKYDNFVDSMGDSIDSGKDWVGDRIEDLADWWNELRR